MAGYNPLMVAVAISAYWAGREVAQAEHRWIYKYTPNKTRSEMPVLQAYYDPRAWDKKSFFGDLVIPFVLSIGLSMLLNTEVINETRERLASIL